MEPTLGKFVLYDEPLNFTEAQEYCQLYWGTSLASIHSEEERDEAEELCRSRSKGTGCWIGLYRVLKGIPGKPWFWEDATPLDYGFNDDGSATRGVDPWYTNELRNLFFCLFFIFFPFCFVKINGSESACCE